MANIAVILSGCGYLDGAEIRESVITLLELDRAGTNVTIFAPDIPQADVVDHISGNPVNGATRNVLEESARIARGKIQNLSQARVEDFDALVIPGGFGVAKNLSNLAIAGKDAAVLPEFKRLLEAFLKAGKPIGAICITPAVLVAAVNDQIKPTVTIGKDEDNMIGALGGVSKACTSAEIAVDNENNIVSTPAYMHEEPIRNVAEGIAKLVEEVVQRAKKLSKAA